MNFLRRHWPDLIISLLIVALLIGFGVVLLGGKGKLAAGDQSAATTNAPDTTPPDTTGNSASAPSTTGGSAAQTPASPTASSSGAGNIPQAPGDIPTIPAQPDQTAGGAADSVAGAGSAASSSQNTDTQSTGAVSAAPSAATSSATTQATSAGSVTGTAVPTISGDIPTRQQYRVSVGTFGSEAEGARSTQAITQLGYTVHFISVAQGVVAQIGPFADEATTRRALADINRVYSGAILRTPAGVSASATSTGGQSDQSQGAQSQSSSQTGAASQAGSNGVSSAASNGSSSTDPTQSDQAPPPDAPVYLQVGAFDQQDRAQTLVQQLKDLGYAPVVQAPPGRKVTVLVGPYTGAALTRTEARLSQNNIDHFRVR